MYKSEYCVDVSNHQLENQMGKITFVGQRLCVHVCSFVCYTQRNNNFKCAGFQIKKLCIFIKGPFKKIRISDQTHHASATEDIFGFGLFVFSLLSCFMHFSSRQDGIRLPAGLYHFGTQDQPLLQCSSATLTVILMPRQLCLF